MKEYRDEIKPNAIMNALLSFQTTWVRVKMKRISEEYWYLP